MWQSGKKARWPRLPDLRFKVQDRVECRIGPHPVKGELSLCGVKMRCGVRIGWLNNTQLN